MGRNTAELQPICWDVRDLIGKNVHFEVCDCGTVEPRDFIMLDQVVASDSAALPISYGKRFDPDNPNDSAEVADALPEAYKALQSGDFHEVAVPGKTYRMELSKAVSWPEGPADWLEFHFSPVPTHHAQTFHSLTMTVEAGGKTFQGRPVSTGRLFEPRTWVCYIPANLVPSRRGGVKMTQIATANRLKILPGPAPDKPQLPTSVRNALTSTYNIPYADPWAIQYMNKYGLWRWPAETDAAYLLRAYRFFQRYFIYTTVRWGWLAG